MLKNFYVIGYFSKPAEMVLRSLASLSDEKHMTILPQFSMEAERFFEFSESLSAALVEFANSNACEYSVESIGSEIFNSLRGSTSVQLINKTIEIEELHLTAREIAKDLSAVFENEAYCGSGYNPHVSHAEDNFSARLTHVGITTYEELPFKTEILSLFDLEALSVELTTAA